MAFLGTLRNLTNVTKQAYQCNRWYRAVQNNNQLRFKSNISNVSATSISKSSRRHRATSAEVASDTIPHPPPMGMNKEYPTKIKNIVDDIARLTLIEVADLNELLKKTLNIQDAPMMAMGAMAAPQAPAEEEEVVSKKVQTAFTLKLEKFDDTRKVALIKEIKNSMEGTNLVQAKKFVESAPQIVKADLTKDEADKLKAALEAVGGTCTIV